MYVVIAGAGLVGGGLAERLCEAKHDVVVIDQNRGVCELVTQRLGAMTFCGSATSMDVLEQAGTARADVAVATMRSDADNLAFALLAKSVGVPRIVARMRDQRYERAYKEAGVAATVQIVDVFVNQLLLEIEQPHLRQVATFGTGGASIVVDTVPEAAAVAGKTIGEVGASGEFPAKCVVTGIYRPEAGDRVFLVASHQDLRKASRFLHRR
jgi:trk system potassium uptake protein TrkA